MSSASILSVIQHYQRSIESSQTDEPRLLHCVSKLYKLPVKVEHLQETGVGKTVNSLRKFDGEIGAAAKALVAKWKAMVAAEEDPMEVSYQQDEHNSDDKGGDSGNDDEKTDQSGSKGGNVYDEGAACTPKSTTSWGKGCQQIPVKMEVKGKEHKCSQQSPPESHHRSLSAGSRSDSSSKPASKPTHSSSNPEYKQEEKHHSRQSRHREEKEVKAERNETERHKGDDASESKEGKYKSSSPSRHRKSSSAGREGKKSSKEDHHMKKAGDSNDTHRGRSREESDRRKSRADHEKHSSSSKHKDRKLEKTSLKNHEKVASSHSRDKGKNKSTSSASTSTKVKSSVADAPASSSAASSSTSAERKRRRRDSEHESSNDAKVSPQIHPTKHSKVGGGKTRANEEDEDCIDSSTGANFADVLGMLNVPTKKSKKTASSTKQHGTSTKPASSTSAKSSSTAKESSKLSDTKRSEPSSNTASSSRNLDLKPSLLSSSAKLEPLDPTITLDLPPISTNYKPLPPNQTIMECVFPPYFVANVPKAPTRITTDEEAMNVGICSKTKRTKIYSGVRPGQLLQVPTLFDLCIRVLQKNIDALEYTGGVPFEVLRPVLERATPQQLLVFEEYNPYLLEDSDTLWQQHVQRHHRTQKRMEMESWREMFLRCQEDQDRKLNILAESIKQSQKVIEAPKRKTQLAFVDSMVKPPRNVLRKQEQYGTKSQLTATPAARVAALSNVIPNAAKTGDARLRIAASVRDNAQVHSLVRPKKAPLMAKTLQLMRGRQKR